MKHIISLLVFFIALNLHSQTKKLEITNSKTGKSIFFESNQNIKIVTITKEKIIGDLSITDNETISVNGNPIKLDNIVSIKNLPKKGRNIKKIVLATGLGLVAGSGIAAAVGNGNAFTLFGFGAATTIVGGLLDNKTYLKNRCVFKIIE
jgi:hypothetical protein